MKKVLLQLFLWLFPWSIRRKLLIKLCGYEIAKDAHIGFSIILAKKLIMGKGSYIGHLTMCKPIDLLVLGENSSIGTRNYITGFSMTSPEVLKYGHFNHIPNRQCVFIIGKHTGITSRHYFDCNGGIYIGDYCEIAGFETAFLTHSIDLKNNRQDAAPINIGDYSFISTRVTVLKGAKVPPHSIIGACSLVNKPLEDTFSLYGGCPCKFIKKVESYDYFNRSEGFVK